MSASLSLTFNCILESDSNSDSKPPPKPHFAALAQPTAPLRIAVLPNTPSTQPRVHAVRSVRKHKAHPRPSLLPKPRASSFGLGLYQPGPVASGSQSQDAIFTLPENDRSGSFGFSGLTEKEIDERVRTPFQF